MKKIGDYIHVIRRLSGFIFYSTLGLLLFNPISYIIASRINKPINFPWLNISVYVLACILLITPGIVIWFAPWFACAWLSGINPLIPRKPWEELTNFQKALIYLASLGFLAAGIAIVYGVIIGIFPLS